MNKYIKYSLITLIIIILITIFTNTGKVKSFVITSLGGYTEKENVVTIDTVLVRRDSIYYPKNILVTADRLNNKVLELMSKNNFLQQKLTLLQLQDTANSGQILTYKHENFVNDTILSGLILTRINPENCEILEQNFTYNLKRPHTITITRNIEKSIENTISIKPKNRIGLGIDYDTDNSIKPSLGLLTKKRILYKIGYEINNNVNYNVGNPSNNTVINFGIMYFL